MLIVLNYSFKIYSIKILTEVIYALIILIVKTYGTN